MNRFLLGLLGSLITFFKLHKMMYFIRATGESIKLEFKKRDFGPYAKNLRYILNAVEEYFISGCTDESNNRYMRIELAPRAVDDADFLLRKYPIAVAQMERAYDLIGCYTMRILPMWIK